MKILNYTQDPINIIANAIFNPKLKKWIAKNPIISRTIPSSGNLTASVAVDEDNPNNTKDAKVVKVVHIDPLPSEEADMIIVSDMYNMAMRILYGPSNVLFYGPDYPVYDTTGKNLIGARIICPKFMKIIIP